MCSCRFFFKDLTISAVQLIGDGSSPRSIYKALPTKSTATQLFALAMTDAALFHGLLQHWARHISFLTGNSTSLECEFHRMKAIHYLNERLQNLTDEISNSVILTVATLTHISVCPSLYVYFEDFLTLYHKIASGWGP